MATYSHIWSYIIFIGPSLLAAEAGCYILYIHHVIELAMTLRLTHPGIRSHSARSAPQLRSAALKKSINFFPEGAPPPRPPFKSAWGPQENIYFFRPGSLQEHIYLFFLRGAPPPQTPFKSAWRPPRFTDTFHQIPQAY